jgi:hypothetical protein
MTSTLNWNLREHLHRFRDGGKGQELRWPVLTALILHSNQRGRCWPGQELIADEVGTDQARVSSAICWLFEHGAIYNVPYEHRVGAERELQPSKYVYQLTSLIRFGDIVVPYLYETDEATEAMKQELLHIGADSVVAFLNGEVESVNYAPSAYHSDAPSAYANGAYKGSTVFQGNTDKKIQITGSGDPASLSDVNLGKTAGEQLPADPPSSDIKKKEKASIPDDYTNLEQYLCKLLGQSRLAADARETLRRPSRSDEVDDTPSPNDLFDTENTNEAYRRWIGDVAYEWWERKAKGGGSVSFASIVADYDWFQRWLVKDNEVTVADVMHEYGIEPLDLSQVDTREFFDDDLPYQPDEEEDE